MLRHVSIGLLGLAATFLSAGDLFAQGSGFSGAMLGGGGGGGMSGGGGGGGFGSTGLGSSLGGTNQGGGLSMMYAASLSGGFGTLGFGGANGFGSSTSMYGGRAYGAATSAGGSNGMGGGMSGGGSRPTSSSGGGGGGAATGGGGRNRGARAAAAAAQSAQDAWFEPKIEIGFDVPETRKSAVARTVADSMGANKSGSRFGGVQVSMAGSVAILRGTVASTNDRQLAEQISLLDPSVTSVRNELTVNPPPKKKTVSQ